MDVRWSVIWFPEQEMLLRVEVQCEVQEIDRLQVRPDGDPQTEGAEVLS